MSYPTARHFWKMNGLGNRILVVDCRGGAPVPSRDEVIAAARAPQTRFDQMMVLAPAEAAGAAARVLIFNADGSEAGACGNGMRCVAWYEAERTGGRRLAFDTIAGRLDADVESIDTITVNMGRPRFGWADIPLSEPFHDTRGIELQIGPIDNPVLHSPAVVNVGNPHAVFFVDDVAAYDLAGAGPLLEHHPIFPEGANISLAQVVDRGHILLRTWERGAGLTEACGSAACAAAVCGARKKLVNRSVAVDLPGGRLTIVWRDDDTITMTGPVVVEATGTLEAPHSLRAS